MSRVVVETVSGSSQGRIFVAVGEQIEEVRGLVDSLTSVDGASPGRTALEWWDRPWMWPMVADPWWERVSLILVTVTRSPHS